MSATLPGTLTLMLGISWNNHWLPMTALAKLCFSITASTLTKQLTRSSLIKPVFAMTLGIFKGH